MAAVISEREWSQRMELREMISDLRTAKRMKQAELAAALEISPQYLCDVELGRRLGSVDLVNKICEFTRAKGAKRTKWHLAAARAHGWEV